MKQLAFVLHESFSSILENYLMLVRPDLQCESPYFLGLWYFYLKLQCTKCTCEDYENIPQLLLDIPSVPRL